MTVNIDEIGMTTINYAEQALRVLEDARLIPERQATLSALDVILREVEAAAETLRKMEELRL